MTQRDRETFSTFEHPLGETTPCEFEFAVARGAVLSALFGTPRHRLGRYELGQRLGQGAYGTVFAGRDLDLDRRVAVKVVDVAATPVRLSEAQAMARISHPNVVEVYDVGYHGDAMYIVMEAVDGVNLEVWLDANRRESQILRVFVDAARGLHAAHVAGLVHRDFKPSNVLIAADVAKVTDFGLAQASPQTGSRGEHPVAGTPLYMAPEQHQGSAFDARADQYSFCAALWEAVGGRPAFGYQTLQALLDAKLRGPPSSRPRSMPRRLFAVLRRGLSVDPQRRYATMLELVVDLERAAGRRTPRVAAAATAAAAISFAAFAGLAQRGEAVHEEAQTEAAASSSVPVAAEQGPAEAVRTAIEAAQHQSPQEALVTLDELLVDAKAVEDIAAIAALHSARGDVLLRLDRTQEAIAGLREAYFLVTPSGQHPAAALRAALELAYAYGVRQRQPDAGERWMSAAEALVSHNEDRPELVSRVFATRGSIQAEAGQVSQALASFREALRRCEPTGRCAARYVERTRGNYASALVDAGEHEQALAILDSVLREQTDRLGGDHVDVGVTSNRLGAVMSLRGQHAAAGDHFRRSRSIFETQLGPEHPDTITALAGLGNVAQAQGDLAEARLLYRSVVRGLDAKQDVKRADVLNNLGVIALELDEPDAAVDSYQAAVDVYTVALGRTHPHVGIALFGLGYALLSRDEAKPAIAAFEEALRIAELDDKTQGRRPSETRLWLAQALLAAGQDPARARAMLQTAAAGFEALGAPAADRLRQTRDVLAQLE